MGTFRFFRLRFRQAYDSAYDSDFRFSLGHKLSYDSDYDSDSDSVASENQPLSSLVTGDGGKRGSLCQIPHPRWPPSGGDNFQCTTLWGGLRILCHGKDAGEDFEVQLRLRF